MRTNAGLSSELPASAGFHAKGTVIAVGPPVEVQLTGRHSSGTLQLPVMDSTVVVVGNVVLVEFFSDHPTDGVIVGVIP